MKPAFTPRSPEVFDYVIVGAGSAGCVLANRLSADPAISVLLLEAGGKDDNWWIHVPIGMSMLLGNPEVDWCYHSEPEPYADQRVTPVPRGKVLGGSSAINALCYILGHANDYDQWAAQGNPGWSWREVLPHFKAIERDLGVQDTTQRWPVVEAWRESARACGLRDTADHNQGENEGMAYFRGTIRGGRRSSAAEAFLHPVRKRPNLKVVTHAHARGLRFNGRRVTGIEYQLGHERRHVEARAEVILAAGAIGSPQLLELSGIGKASLLRRAGIGVIHERPGVGENMQDHWQVRVTYKVKDTLTMNEWTRGWRRYLMGARYLLKKDGPMGTQTPQLCAFTKSDPAQPFANLQYHVTAASADHFGGPLHDWPGLSCGIAVVRPQSIGHTHIKSPDPMHHPSILHNFLREPAAQQVAVDAIRLTRRIAQGTALAPFSPEEYLPGPKVQSDEEILAYARQTVITVFHQSGTCRMGDDALGVVDERLRVRGFERLRVVDASIMPSVVSGNTNAPTMMIADKGAKMILEDRRSL